MVKSSEPNIHHDFLGISQFQDTVSSTSKRSYTFSDEYHLYVAKSRDLVTRQQVASYFDVTEDSAYRHLKKYKCITDLGSKSKIYSHNKIVCQLGIVQGKIPPTQFRITDLTKLNLPPWFDIWNLLFEISGEQLTSPEGKEVCDSRIDEDFTIEWAYCKFRVRIKYGKIDVWMGPKEPGKGYGLHLERYLEYRDHVNYTLEKILNFKPIIFTVRFDLQQDDHRHEYTDPIQANEVIRNLFKLQQYASYRDDHPLSKKAMWMKHKEIIHYNREAVEQAPIVQEVLSKSAKTIDSVLELRDLAKTLEKRLTNNHLEHRNYLADLGEVVDNFGNVVNNQGEFYKHLDYNMKTFKESINQQMGSVLVEVDNMSSNVNELGIVVDKVGNVVDDYTSLANDALQVIANHSRIIGENSTVTANAVQEVNNSIARIDIKIFQFETKLTNFMKLTQVEKLDLYEHLLDLGNNYREIAKTLTDLNDNFEISFQGVQQYYTNHRGSYHKNKLKNKNYDQSTDFEPEISNDNEAVSSPQLIEPFNEYLKNEYGINSLNESQSNQVAAVLEKHGSMISDDAIKLLPHLLPGSIRRALTKLLNNPNKNISIEKIKVESVKSKNKWRVLYIWGRVTDSDSITT